MPALIFHRQPVHNLYALRTAIHLSAATVAKQVGVSLDTYYNWEQGKTNPSHQHRQRLVRVLRTTEAHLRGRDGGTRMPSRLTPHQRNLPTLVCACGSIILTCTATQCTVVHTVREVPACGVCTATGGLVDLESVSDTEE